MARIELELPERFHFRTEIGVRIDDVNYGGHVGHDRLLTLLHEARVRLFGARGWSELDVGGSGTGIAIVDLAAVYSAEVHHGMTLVAELAVGAVRPRGFELFYRLSDLASGRELVRVKTGIVFFDYHTRKVARTPAAFRAAFGET